MGPFTPTIAGLALLARVVSAAEAPDLTVGEMGPGAFMWPPERVWSAAADNTAPCGSVEGVGNRTLFPLTNGKVALLAQEEDFDIQLSVSYLQSPQTNTDFNVLIDASAFRELDLGHTCVNLPNAPSSVKANTNATLQIKYTSPDNTPNNQTFYACTDITYVALSDFDISIPCFNATAPEPTTQPTASPSGGSSSGDSAASSTATSVPSSGGSGSKLSGGAIAGIVVGCVAAVGLVAGAALLIYRRKQQRLSALRQQHSARGVKWEDNPARESASASSVRMQNLSS